MQILSRPVRKKRSHLVFMLLLSASPRPPHFNVERHTVADQKTQMCVFLAPRESPPRRAHINIEMWGRGAVRAHAGARVCVFFAPDGAKARRLVCSEAIAAETHNDRGRKRERERERRGGREGGREREKERERPRGRDRGRRRQRERERERERGERQREIKRERERDGLSCPLLSVSASF